MRYLLLMLLLTGCAEPPTAPHSVGMKGMIDTVYRTELPLLGLELLPHPDHLDDYPAASITPGRDYARMVWWVRANRDYPLTLRMLLYSRCGVTPDIIDSIRVLMSMYSMTLTPAIDGTMSIQGVEHDIRFEREMAVDIEDPQTKHTAGYTTVRAVPATGWITVAGFGDCEGDLVDDTLSITLTLDVPYLVDSAHAGPQPLVVYVQGRGDVVDYLRDPEPVAEMRVGMRDVR